MKNFGFSLTEVLITLSIIGVIAALTAPALVHSSKNEANGAKLAVTVSNLESAFTNAIAMENVSDLFQTNMWKHVPKGSTLVNGADNDDKITAFVDELSKYLVINGFKNESASNFYGSKSIRGLDGSNNVGWGGEVFPIMMRNGAVVFVRAAAKGVFVAGSTDNDGKKIEATENEVRSKGGSLYEEAADIFIDINGVEGPNIVGRDLFTFYLGQNGVLYPAGGVDVSIFENTNDNNPGKQVWSNPDTESDGSWSCIEGHIANHGWGCTARLIEENYKMNY